MKKTRYHALVAQQKKWLLGLAAVTMSCSLQAQNDSIHALHEVVVTGTRNAVDVRQLPFTVSVINQKTLTSQYQPSLLPTVMQQVPGLFVTSRSMMGYGVSTGAAGGINLRGITGGAGQLLVLIDGHPQYNGIYGHPISDSYQTLMAERVEVLRGPASVLYGSNAMGGVMNIVTRRNVVNGDSTQVTLGVGSYGTVQLECLNQLRYDKFSSTVGVQFNRTDNHRPRMGFEESVAYAKFGYDISKHWNAYFDGNYTHFKSSYPGSTDSPLYDADQWITRGAVSAALENHFDNTSGAVSVFCNFGRHKIDDGTPNPDNPTMRYFRSKDALTGVSVYQSAQFFAGNRVTLGVDYQHIYGRAYYTSKETGEVLETPNKQSGRSLRNEIAGYIDFRQNLVNWLTVDAGLRIDHHSVAGTELVPQFGFVVRPTATGEMKAMVSKGFRNPTMREMFLYPPSNEELEAECLWNYELSWRQRFGSFSYGMNLYYIKGDNMIQTVERKNVNTGEIENYGVDLEAVWQLNSHWSLSSNHSLLHMKHKILAAPSYKGFLGADFQQKKWHVVAGLQYVNGLYTEVGTNEQKENFLLFNTTVSYQILRNLSCWIRGENLLAQTYEVIKGYPMPHATFMTGFSMKL